MRTELQAKFIQHLNSRKDSTAGFTLIELLVAILILGILTAIAIPNLLNHDAKARQAEGKQNVALINKAQNSYRAENASFASTFDALAIGSVSGGTSASTTSYSYTISGSIDSATVGSTPIDGKLKGYVGGIVRFTNAANQSVIGTVLCETSVPGAVANAPNTPVGAKPTCTPATQNTLSL